MSRKATWKVIDPDFEPDGEVSDFPCLHCGREAVLPVSGHPGVMIIAQVGQSFVTDPPGLQTRDGWLPSTIRCRKCGHIYTTLDDDELAAVLAADRQARGMTAA